MTRRNQLGKAPPTKCSIVVEVGQAHEGSESYAHAFIEEVSRSGADAVKFQLHRAADESSLNDRFREEVRYGRESRFDYWRRHEMSASMVEGLVAHSRDVGLQIGFSTFSLEGLRLLSDFQLDFVKIGSGEAIQPWFVREAAELEFPIVLSTGLSTLGEIEDAIHLFEGKKREVTLLQCTTQYPSNLESVGMNVLDVFREKFDVPVGLSDHTGKISPALMAFSMGADMVEVHGTFSKRTGGPDAASSLTFAELSFLGEMRDEFSILECNPVDKNQISNELSDHRQVFGRSLAFRTDLRAGTRLRDEDLYFAKPGGGFRVEDLGEVVGKVLRRDVQANHLLADKDICS